MFLNNKDNFLHIINNLFFQITFFIGTLVNEVINMILKHIIKEERPAARESLYSEYGMPSSHSQFMWFFTTYIIYFIFIRYLTFNITSFLNYVYAVYLYSLLFSPFQVASYK